MITKKKFRELFLTMPDGRIIRDDIGDGWVGCMLLRLKFFSEKHHSPSLHMSPVLSSRRSGFLGSHRLNANKQIEADMVKLSSWLTEFRQSQEDTQ